MENLTSPLKSAPQNYPENALKPQSHDIHLKLLRCELMNCTGFVTPKFKRR